MTDQDLRLYILMRNDLDSMSVGRCMAQASHAANALETAHRNHPRVLKWKKQTSQGFGTCIVLAACKEKIDDVIRRWPGATCGRVIDPDYGIKTTWELFKLIDKKKYHRWVSCDARGSTGVVFFIKEMTCAYLLGTKAELDPFIGDLSLY